ncbi:MAG TPA: hypothetical protein PLZ43_06340, partial [bacterium]|nr:hypothetical protein [bacterium]
ESSESSDPQLITNAAAIISIIVINNFFIQSLQINKKTNQAPNSTQRRFYTSVFFCQAKKTAVICNQWLDFSVKRSSFSARLFSFIFEITG